MDKLLVVGAGLISEEIVNVAKSMGVYTIVTDNNPPEISHAKLVADEYWMISTSDLDALEAKCREEGVTGVITAPNEYNQKQALELSKRLGFPWYCTPESWHYSVNKADFKAVCKKVGCPVPTDYVVTDALSREELSKIVYPVMVKPVDMCSNIGISYCYNEDDLIKAYHLARSVSKNPKIIVEQMLLGKELFSVYAFAEGEVRLIAVASTDSQPGEIKNLYSLCSTISEQVEAFNKKINPAIERVLKEIGCREGIAWVQEMMDEEGNFYAIEMGYRLFGDMTFIGFPYVMDFDVIKWYINVVCGRKNTVEMLPKAQKHMYEKCCCGYSIWTNRAGTISTITGVDEILKIPGVSFHCIRRAGYEFKEHVSLGVICVYAENCDELCKKIEQINNTFSIIDENGNNVMIYYTDYEHLKTNYNLGLANKKKV